MRLSIETTLFRPEQADPFFDSLQSYRDSILYLTLGSSWLELKKSREDKKAENVPYNIVGARVSGKGSLPERVLNLFEQRHLPVEACSASKLQLPAVDPVSTKAFSFEMSQIYKRKQGPSRDTRGMLIQNVLLWRPWQLNTLSFWVNSYYDKSVEVGVSAGKQRAFLMLRKFGRSDEDPPYVVAGCASEEIDIFSYLAGMIPLNRDNPPVKAYMMNAEHDEVWNFFKAPMPLNQFMSVVSLQYDERKRF